MKKYPKTNILFFGLLMSGVLMSGCGGGGAGGVGGGGNGGGSGARSPETVVFLSQDKQQLIAAADDAGAANTVLSQTPYTGITTFKVSPDGAFVAYIADATVGGQYDLYVSKVTGDGETKISNLNYTYDEVKDFAWSPDSSKLAFLADDVTDNIYKLYIANVSSDSEYEASNLADTQTITDYGWSPDSHYVAYVADTSILYTHDATQDMQNANQLFAVSDSKTREITSFQWSPDSMKLAFRTDSPSSLDNQYQIMIINPDGSTTAIVANGSPGSSVEIGAYDWSPDSRYLAQRVLKFPDTGSLIGINVVDTTLLSDTFSASHRVVTSTAFGELHWAHNSNQLAFEEKNVAALYVYDADSQTMNSVNNSMDANEALKLDELLWSPNDASIAYLTDINGSDRLYITPADASSSAVQVGVPANFSITGLSWSGDGSKLGALALKDSEAFHPGNWYIFGIQGQQVWKSDDIYTYDSSRMMKWSIDNTRVVYSSGEYGVFKSDYLHGAEVESGNSVVISTTPASPDQVFEYGE